MGRPISTPSGTDNRKAKLTHEVANEMQKNNQKVKLRTGSQHAVERWFGEDGRETANSLKDKQKPQQGYLQQKTEKFHLFSSPDAPTKSETGKRQTDGEKNV